MTVLPDDPWRSSPRYSLGVFERRLQDANPAILAERPAGQYYDACTRRQIDPAWAVETLFKESSGGKAGVALHTHSWGNTGYPAFGPAPLPADQDAIGLDDKRFPAYRTWLEGLESTLERLLAPNWVYSKRHAIAELYDHPSGDVWAPARHYNDPRGYLNFLITNINARADLPGTLTVPQPLAIRDWIIAPTRKAQRPGHKLRSRWGVTNHDTGNPDDTADAAMHAHLLAHNPSWGEASWHYSVDDGDVIRSLPDDEVGWHAGDGPGPGNFTTRAIELCINADGNWWATRRNGAALAAQLLAEDGHGIERLVQHNHWLLSEVYWPRLGRHKNCPAKMRGDGTWEFYTEMVQRVLAADGHSQPTGGHRFFDLDGQNRGHYVGGGFQAFWESMPGAFFIFEGAP